jgi:hypothetical protein
MSREVFGLRTNPPLQEVCAPPLATFTLDALPSSPLLSELTQGQITHREIAPQIARRCVLKENAPALGNVGAELQRWPEPFFLRRKRPAHSISPRGTRQRRKPQKSLGGFID